MAQNMSICNFCELSNEIKWKCINCDMILCAECKTIKHSKFKGFELHTIIELNRLGTKEVISAIRKLDLQKIMCTCHCDEKCCLYCEDCRLPICLSCILEKHSGHKAARIGFVYDNQNSELEQFRSSVEMELSLCAEQCDRKQRFLNSYSTIKEKILEREKLLKGFITAQAANLMKELDDIYSYDDTSFAKEEEKLQKYEKDMKRKKAIVDEVLDSCDARSVFNTLDQIDFKLPEKFFKELPQEHITFFTLGEPVVDIKFNMWPLKKAPRMVEIIEIYDTGKLDISKLKTLKNGTYVMTDDRHSTLKQFFFQDHKCEFVKSIDASVFDITVTNEAFVLASYGDSEVIYNITESRNEIFKSLLSPRLARGIHVDENNKLFVGFIDPNNIYQTGIVVFDLKSDQVQEFAIHADSDSFIIPDKITTKLNGDICVIQSKIVTSWIGIVILYEFSHPLAQVKWIYKGHKIINSSLEFSPCDIVTTTTDLVLTSDLLTKTIHVLSSNGDFLTLIGEQEGVFSPRSLIINKEGRLLIGSFQTDDDCSKIYVAKFVT
ncbi:unnamed protein product [Mytilus coruscus]|uniref:B box-type domain-containing protein n=1 Tax=Mytilus coruscus TaxID=42192 RepID=A0A6J8C5M0_MYTCO|nr:unnamed protein product [Mytilus coruscus]